ncbi:MAG: hypothetical protein NVSMB32_00070 [Actinomycetota bacterium]
MTTTTAYVSTPAISLGGQDDPALAQDLLALAIEETVVGMSWCEARFNNFGYRNGSPGYLYLGRDRLDFGKTRAITVGPRDDSRRVFAGKISAIQADYPLTDPAQVLVFAEDGLQDLRLTRRTRTFEQATTASIARHIASDHNLTPSISLNSPSRKVAVQVNQSDLAFLRAIAREDDGEVWLDGNDLHLQRRPDRDAGTMSLAYGERLLTFSVRADLANQVTELEVCGWDVAAKEAIRETSDATSLGSELGSDNSGSSILSQAFGERKEHAVRGVPLASDQARSLARAMYLERARRFVCGTGLTDGTPALRVGGRVTLAGLGGMLDGTYCVSRTRHMFSLDQGYRTEFDVERAGIGAAR